MRLAFMVEVIQKYSTSKLGGGMEAKTLAKSQPREGGVPKEETHPRPPIYQDKLLRAVEEEGRALPGGGSNTTGPGYGVAGPTC